MFSIHKKEWRTVFLKNPIFSVFVENGDRFIAIVGCHKVSRHLLGIPGEPELRHERRDQSENPSLRKRGRETFIALSADPNCPLVKPLVDVPRASRPSEWLLIASLTTATTATTTKRARIDKRSRHAATANSHERADLESDTARDRKPIARRPRGQSSEKPRPARSQTELCRKTGTIVLLSEMPPVRTPKTPRWDIALATIIIIIVVVILRSIVI